MNIDHIRYFLIKKQNLFICNGNDLISEVFVELLVLVAVVVVAVVVSTPQIKAACRT
jgi:hypothetical protein